MLLTPQNPFTFLQFAETAYTSGDIPLALKMFLVVIDMNEVEDEDAIPLGISVRAWWGTKLVSAFHHHDPEAIGPYSITVFPGTCRLVGVSHISIQYPRTQEHQTH